MKIITKILLFVFVVLFTASCKENSMIEIEPTEQEIISKYLDIPASPYNYANQDLPSFFSNQFVKIQDNTPENNRVTDWGATLGRVLFYDKRLSINNSISCASCHSQQFGFTDTAVFSKGFNGGSTKRHSMSLLNAAFY
ncbi:MAG: cytochrome-c peroxidase, partial [Sphingobacteriales bacterium]